MPESCGRIVPTGTRGVAWNARERFNLSIQFMARGRLVVGRKFRGRNDNNGLWVGACRSDDRRVARNS